MQTLKRIAHATDFSAHSRVAFLHALRIAVAARARLDILHVHKHRTAEDWADFPHVREPLVRWGLLAAGDPRQAIEARLGVHVAKVEIDHGTPADGLADFLTGHRPDLLVLASEGRSGWLDGWLHRSVSEATVQRTHIPALLIGPDDHGFVEPETGLMQINRVLVPVLDEPSPAVSLHRIVQLLAPLGVTPDRLHLMTVNAAGAAPLPDVLDASGHACRVGRFDGEPVGTILGVAEHSGADLIAIPTSGRHGILDAIRGSTTSRIVARATCPVLTIPVT